MNRARAHKALDELLDALAEEAESPLSAKRIPKRKPRTLAFPEPSVVPSEIDRARARRILARES